MSVNLKDYYEAYWSADQPVPDQDPTTGERKQRLRAALSGLDRRERILDMGCGSGQFVSFIASLGYEARGVDVSQAAIDRARRTHPSLAFDVLVREQIPFPEEHFAAVWSSEVLEHVFDVHNHLSEINRVLVHGGRYVLTTPYHGRVKDVLVALLRFDGHFDPEKSHIRFFDRAGLRRCLERAGFTIRQYAGIGRFWPLYRTWFVVAEKTGQPLTRPREQ